MLPALGRKPSEVHHSAPRIAARSGFLAASGGRAQSGFIAANDWEGRGASQVRSKSTPLVRRPKETVWDTPNSARMDDEIAEEELYFRGGGGRGGEYDSQRGGGLRGGGGGGRPPVDAFPQVVFLEISPCPWSSTVPSAGQAPHSHPASRARSGARNRRQSARSRCQSTTNSCFRR